MASIVIDNNVIKYTAPYDLPYKDSSWTLPVEEIAVIGFVNRMDGDDDTNFLIFINRDTEKYILTLYDIPNISSVLAKLKEYFDFKIPQEEYNFDCILFPKKLTGFRLYKFSLGKTVKRIAAVVHVAEGDLSDGVVEFLNESKK